MNRTRKYEYIDDYLLTIRSKGGFAFTFEELNQAFDSSGHAIRKKIYRLKADNKIAIIRKNFYVVLPPEYTDKGSLPIYLYIDDLMKYLDRNYYVGLYSAAALHGAAQISALQRLGYMFDKVCNRKDLAKSIQRVLKGKATQNILLSIASPQRENIDKDWKVDVNVEIESEL